MRRILSIALISVQICLASIPACATAPRNGLKQAIGGYSLPRLVNAIYHAEGGTKTRYPFGILNKSCEGYDQCRYMAGEIVIVHYKRWNKRGDFLEYLASKYAPVGKHVANDPTGLNVHWLSNVRRLYERG